MLDQNIQEYLEMLLDRFENQIETKLNAAIDKMDYISKGIYLKVEGTDKEIERNKNSISVLYEKNRETEKEIGSISGRVLVLEDDKSDKKTNTGTILIIIGFVITIVFATIGWSR